MKLKSSNTNNFCRLLCLLAVSWLCSTIVYAVDNPPPSKERSSSQLNSTQSSLVQSKDRDSSSNKDRDIESMSLDFIDALKEKKSSSDDTTSKDYNKNSKAMDTLFQDATYENFAPQKDKDSETLLDPTYLGTEA